MNKKLLAIALLCLPFNVLRAQTPTIVADLSPSTSSYPGGLTIYNNILYFSAAINPMDIGKKLFEYDGATVSVSFAPATGNCWQVNKKIVANNTLYGLCTTHPAQQGQPDITSLYSYTGSQPVIVANSDNLPIGGYMAVVGNNLYVTTGAEIVDVMDVTAGNTLSLGINAGYPNVPMIPGMQLYMCTDLITYNNTLYFTGWSSNDALNLYTYDHATNTIDTAIYQSDSQPLNFHGSAPKSFVIGDDNKLYFSAIHPTKGRQLYVIDGNNNAQLLTSLNAGGDGVYGSWAEEGFDLIKKWGNAIYFAGNDGSHGFELMKYDLSTHTATLVKDINTGTSNSVPVGFTLYHGKLYFSATTTSAGTELWSTDGTEAGTSMVADLNPGAGDGLKPATTAGMMVYKDNLYFQGQDAASGYELYKLSTPNGIQMVKLANDVVAYPNPVVSNATVEMNLSSDQKVTLVLSDITGRVIYTSAVQNCIKGTNRIEVPMQQLVHGVYQYRITTDKNELVSAGSLTHI